jgi:hypothetical protein
MTKSVQPSLRLDEGLIGGGKYHPRCAKGQGYDPWLHCAHAHRLSSLVAATRDDRRASR